MKLKAAPFWYAGKFDRGSILPACMAVNFTWISMPCWPAARKPPMQLAKGEFGGRIGIWRLLEMYEAHDIKVTVFTPGRICELYPEALKRAARAGHEIADHMWEHHVPKDKALEEDHLLKTIAALERVAGRRPVGTRSEHSPALLRREGFIYNFSTSCTYTPLYQDDENGVNRR
jgi:peptidoglycan/xylan/chitin deacetylase (PgdA/CDA1 family)